MTKSKANLDSLEIKIVDSKDCWKDIKESALFTEHKKLKTMPSEAWKTMILTAEHSPIRCGYVFLDIRNCPSYVIGHLVRHFNGSIPFVASLRDDRFETDETPDRNTLNDVRLCINFQGFINISRKRLCKKADKNTVYVWQKVKEEVMKYEPELATRMVKECVYRGFCPEMKSCMYFTTEEYKKELEDYRSKIIEARGY